MIGAGLVVGIIIVGIMMFTGDGIKEKLNYGCLFFILLIVALLVVAVGLLQGI